MTAYLLPEFIPGPAPPEPRLPDWFTAGSQAPASHIANVRAGLHPMGFALRVGIDVGARCGNCVHLRSAKWAKVYLKCAMVARQTKGPGTELRRQWHACAKWEPDMGALPLGDPMLAALAERGGSEARAVMFDYMGEHGVRFLAKPRAVKRERQKCQHPGCKRVARCAIGGGGRTATEHYCREHMPGMLTSRDRVIRVENDMDAPVPIQFTVIEDE